MSMNIGDFTKNRQELLEKTGRKSTTHRYATIWRVRCEKCDQQYGSNSCDVHIRRCPYCSHGAAGEPLD